MSFSIKVSKKVGDRTNVIASRNWPQSKITIGRGEECTLVLEDEKKHVSRVHAELEEQGEGSYRLTVVSKVNPVFMGGRRHGPGSRLDLGPGASVDIGDYVIELLAPAAAPKVVSPVTELEETTRPDNPAMMAVRAKLVNEPTVPIEEAPKKPVPVAAPPPPPPPPPPPKPSPAPPPSPPVAEEEPTYTRENIPAIDPLFDEPTLPSQPAAAPVVRPAPAGGDVFGEATYVGKSASAPPTGAFDEATYVGGRPPARPGASPAAAAGGADAQRLMKAFLEGAGMPGKEISSADMEAFMRQSGQLLRSAIDGAMALLAARATAKKELRAEERTMVASRDNNPLKLMSDPQEVLGFLFDTKERAGGFLNPVQAVGDAFEDLRAHEVALFAGMRAALLGAIQRFDPKTLEGELEKAAGGLGLNRKAKLWELFGAYQEKLARDAGDDFNKVFGSEFMGTYMEQVKRLRGGR